MIELFSLLAIFGGFSCVAFVILYIWYIISHAQDYPKKNTKETGPKDK
jgi:hypothetical protein